MSVPQDISSAMLTPDVKDALETLVRVVERQSKEFEASILLLSDDGGRVVDAAGPRLPEEYRNAIHGTEIGPAAGSCGTALYRNVRVIVSDIQTDPLWAEYRHLARPHGFRACWSQPIRSPDGEPLGTFAMYYHERRSPTKDELEIIEAAADRAGALLERARTGVQREELLAGLA